MAFVRASSGIPMGTIRHSYGRRAEFVLVFVTKALHDFKVGNAHTDKPDTSDSQLPSFHSVPFTAYVNIKDKILKDTNC